MGSNITMRNKTPEKCMVAALVLLAYLIIACLIIPNENPRNGRTHSDDRKREESIKQPKRLWIQSKNKCTFINPLYEIKDKKNKVTDVLPKSHYQVSNIEHIIDVHVYPAHLPPRLHGGLGGTEQFAEAVHPDLTVRIRNEDERENEIVTHNRIESNDRVATDNTGTTNSRVITDNRGTTNNRGATDNTGTTNSRGITDNTGTTNNRGATDNRDTANNRGATDNTGATNNRGITDNTGTTNNRGATDNKGDTEIRDAINNRDSRCVADNLNGMEACAASRQDDETVSSTGDQSSTRSPQGYLRGMVSVTVHFGKAEMTFLVLRGMRVDDFVRSEEFIQKVRYQWGIRKCDLQNMVLRDHYQVIETFDTDCKIRLDRGHMDLFLD